MKISNNRPDKEGKTGMKSIHPSALIDDGAVLGEGVCVGPYAVIEAGAKLGKGCSIGPHVTVTGACELGSDCRVHAGAVIGDLPQDTAFKGGESFVRIGDGCTIREGVTIHRGTTPGSTTAIGDRCFLMAFSHFAHNVSVGDDVIVANGALLGGYVEVGNGVFISGNCLVHQFVRIGRLAMLGGGSGVSKDVPPFMTTRTLGFNRIAGMNVVGLRRSGVSAEERLQIKKAFTLLFRSGLNTSEAVKRISAELPEGPAAEICGFVEASERGICSMAVSE